MSNEVLGISSPSIKLPEGKLVEEFPCSSDLMQREDRTICIKELLGKYTPLQQIFRWWTK